MRRCIPWIVITGSMLVGIPAAADSSTEPGVGAGTTTSGATPRYNALLEVGGDWGFQFGPQEYVPATGSETSKNPLTNGFGFNATAGVSVARDIDIIGDYGFGDATSRTGEVQGALTGVTGSITYHTLALGTRLYRELGSGRLYAQLALGVVLPFSTTVKYEYDPGLAPLGISGTGTMEDHYTVGVGGHAELGYQVALPYNMYVATALRLQTFQSSNDGESTTLTNFVPDFTNPRVVNMEIHYGTTSAATPSAYSVQDVRFHLAVGYRF